MIDDTMKQALLRVLRGEDVATVAVEMGIAEAKLRRIIDDATEPAEVKSYLVAMADGFGCDGQHECRLTDLDIADKSYTPDCVWWERPRERGKVRAIFEIDKDVSPKHYTGGVALANVVALMAGTPIEFFSIVPLRNRARAERTLRLLERHLGDKWRLRATLIPTLIPSEIRRAIDQAMNTQTRVRGMGE